MKLDHLQPDPWLNISSSTGPKHSNSRAPISLPISSGSTTPTCWKKRPSSSCSSSVSWERINQTRCCSWSSTMPQWRACSSTALVFGMQGLQLRTKAAQRAINHTQKALAAFCLPWRPSSYTPFSWKRRPSPMTPCTPPSTRLTHALWSVHKLSHFPHLQSPKRLLSIRTLNKYCPCWWLLVTIGWT